VRSKDDIVERRRQMAKLEKEFKGEFKIHLFGTFVGIAESFEFNWRTIQVTSGAERHNFPSRLALILRKLSFEVFCTPGDYIEVSFDHQGTQHQYHGIVANEAKGESKFLSIWIDPDDRILRRFIDAKF